MIAPLGTIIVNIFNFNLGFIGSNTTVGYCQPPPRDLYNCTMAIYSSLTAFDKPIVGLPKNKA